ncbi:MAG: hypothetical protein P4L76_18045 [Beijerinckiaceae bacterium]|nr:hypothetical protein [Beijerinckiaceae bacterium]
MTPQEQAEIWRKAARVVDGMDTMNAEMSQAQTQSQMGGSYMSRCYSENEMTANRAYSAAARVLRTIAAEHERAASPLTPGEKGEG